MNVGVIGCGTVGGALAGWLREGGKHAVAVFDPPKGMIDPSIRDAEVVFVCVPTPFVDGLFVDGQGFDDRYLREAFLALSGLPGRVAVIKSTVPPGTTDRLAKEFPQMRLLFSPEFLSDDTAQADTRRPIRQIVGWTEGNEEIARRVLDILPHAPYSFTMTARNAEMVKYFSNAFYALKVAYANQMSDLCAAVGVDYTVVRSAARCDPMVGPDHLQIMHKGYRGYGGKCLPKDVKTILAVAREAGVSLSLLDAAEAYNNALKVT